MGGLAVLVLPALAAIAAQDARAGARAAGQALRMAILVAVPVAAIAAGGAPGMLDLLFGSDYTSGWPVLSILAIGMAALAISSVAAGSLSGIGQPGWSAAIAVIGLAIALFLCIVLVPALGPPGAAMATTASTAVALALLLAKLEASLPGSLPWLSILRITGIAAVLGGGLAILDARGLALIGACVVASVISVGILVVSGEVGGSDVRRLRAGLRR
jgi:O-antigen/teichoic acid export membrane protein